MPKEKKFKVGCLIFLKNTNKTPMIAKITAIKSHDPDSDEHIGDWPILSVVFEDGGKAEISASDAVIPISVDELEILTQQARDLSKQSQL
jgi:hypothetical protein